MTYLEQQSINTLVEQLPEVYQPIFKHPEFTAQASRSCFDRLETITAIYDYISQEKGRPLKVLDLGCAQGFFSLNLAEHGATVTAVDYSQPNIDVCNKLAAENSAFNIEFLLGSIETVITQRIQDQEYDLVLGLSVFHHLIYEHGVAFVFDLFKILAKKVETGVFEFALNSEPLYWAASQPEDPRKLIEPYIFNHHLAMYGTHLSTIERPLFFASNKYWHVGDMYGVIDHYMHRSHQLENFYHGNNRRYYFSDNRIVKIFLGNKKDGNYWELLNESVFLEKEIPGFRASQSICYGSNDRESWLVRTAIPGKLLLDMILNGDDYDDDKIISDVLEQVTILENNGWYHNDLRPWNILIGDDKQVYLIDYGSISTSAADGDDLYGQILSFFVLIKEIAQHRVREQGSSRPLFIAPHDFPEKYKKWMAKVWMMPSQQWNFKSIAAAYYDQSDVTYEIPISAFLESHLSTATNYIGWQTKQLQQLLSSKIDMLADNIRSESQNNANLISEINMQRKITEDLRNELNTVYNCKSWKITQPLRMLSKSVKLSFRPHRLASSLKSVFKKKIKNLIAATNRFISNRPLLRRWVVRLLNRYPSLKYKLKRNLPRNYDGMPSTTSFTDFTVPVNHYGKLEQQQPCSVKKPGVHEKQKSVLESWLY